MEDNSEFEIEAKYEVQSLHDIEDLFSREKLGKYSFVHTSVINTNDYYLDTSDDHIRKAGFFCRIRKIASKIRSQNFELTLKRISDNPPLNEIHLREELSIILNKYEKDYLSWPNSKSKEKVKLLTKGFDLQEKMTLAQQRMVRDIYSEDDLFAELSFDIVTVQRSKRKLAQFNILEIELKSKSHETSFRSITELIKEKYKLSSSKYSKFQIANKILARSNSFKENC